MELRKLSVASAVALAALLAACAAPPVAERLATAQSGYGRAFGRVIFVEDGQEKDWSRFSLAFESLTLFVRRAPGGDVQYMSIEGKGEFSWPLLPGEYVIMGYQTTREPRNQRRTARLWTTFSVPQAGAAAYVGDLRIETQGAGYRFEVTDDYANSVSAHQASFKDGEFRPVKALMRGEGRLGSYQRETGICSDLWGVTCDQTYKGVEPVLPEGTVKGFPTTSSLTPVLEWKPSVRPGVTYDVVIYESLSFGYGLRIVDRLRGARVAYAEALREPRFTPQAPLKPATSYEWTVRLREGGKVSSWSATSYAYFYGLGNSGSGRAFGFATPSGN